MTIRITWKRAIIAVLALAAAAMLFAWSGLFQIAASSGHWKVTDWFLHWTMQNSVRTYSTLQTPKKVSSQTGLVSAAGHFHQACEVCHGAPGMAPSPVMQAATPPAPNLAKTVGHYSDRELFWIVQHGIKYTGMPAWSAQDRPDEVARMVGFLRRLPQMDAREYRALIEGTAPNAIAGLSPGRLESCTGCHGADGMGRGQADIPILAGQKEGYLLDALRRYAAGKRTSGPMQVAAAALDEAEMRALARHFAAMPGLEDAPLPPRHPIITEGLSAKQLPACASCHAPGKGAPLIGGQRALYMRDRLQAWRGEKNVADVHKPQLPMPVIARRIPEDQIDPLVQALSSGR